MPQQFNAPDLRSDFILVVNYARPDLAATALSYLFTEGRYLPIFSFQNVDIAMDKNMVETDIFLIQRNRAEQFSVFLNNAIIENGGCDNLIFLGLSEEQKSYLTFKNHYNVLDIETLEDIPAYLGGYGYDKDKVLECSYEQLGRALVQALVENRILMLGEPTTLVEAQPEPTTGLVLIEAVDNSNLITSINYACTIGSRCVFLNRMDHSEEEEVLHLLEGCQAGDLVALANLKDKINTRIGNVDISKYNFSTFFTYGIPYTVCVKEKPTSMVNLQYRPDFFIFNALVAEKIESIGSAVVFSPSFFKNEETDFLLSFLEFRNFYLRKLIGKLATSYNLKVSIEGYPFDLLHICSHGGDVEGTNCLVEFRDRNNIQHTIEFDHVLTIALTPYRDKHTVNSLYYFKKFDGMTWRSEELKALNYPKELYASLVKEIRNAFDKKRVIKRGPVQRVANANSITCSSGLNYTGNFDQVGISPIHPFIFNNSCWSWKTISTNFLLGGSRGYIGTLREVENDEAVLFAKVFYNNTVDDNIINAYHLATVDFLKAKSDPIYIYWGLHFSTLSNVRPVENNKTNILKKLFENLHIWKRKLGRGEGSGELLQARVSDTIWMIKDILAAK